MDLAYEGSFEDTMSSKRSIFMKNVLWKEMRKRAGQRSASEWIIEAIREKLDREDEVNCPGVLLRMNDSDTEWIDCSSNVTATHQFPAENDARKKRKNR